MRRLLLLFCFGFALKIHAQPAFSAWQMQKLAEQNQLVIDALKARDLKTIDSQFDARVRIDTANLHKTIDRYSPVVNRTDLTLTTKQRQFSGRGWGQVCLFENNWQSADSTEKVSISLMFAFKGGFGIIQSSFYGNITSLSAPQDLAADSLNTVLLDALMKKDIDGIITMFQPGSEIDRKLLEKTVASYQPVVVNAAHTYTYENDRHVSALVFPDRGAWSGSVGNRWIAAAGPDKMYITVYVTVLNGRCYISQLLFTGEKKNTSVLFPGGVYTTTEDGPPPPPPALPPPTPR